MQEKINIELSFPRRRESIGLRIMKQPCVYILASRKNGSLYIGVTSNLIKRVWEHKNHQVEGFTKKYGVSVLVYFEMHQDMSAAIVREKQLKKWRRQWKVRLIEENNPGWNDLFYSLF
jgi:putative endonuclease